MDWATGHGPNSFNYFVMVAASDEDKLKQHNRILLDDYIANAPPTQSTFDPAKQKFHWSKFNTLGAGPEGGYVGPLASDFLRMAKDGDAIKLPPRPDIPVFIGMKSEAYQWIYKPEILAEDRQVSYKSAKYPWIVAVWKYKQPPTHKPSNHDGAVFKVPSDRRVDANGNKIKDYVIHYIWNGYYDCIDVNVIDRSEPVALVYGGDPVDGGATVSQRIDHCFLPEKYDNQRPPVAIGIRGPAMVAVTDASACINQCKKNTLPNRCDGVNYFPYKIPTSRINSEIMKPENNIVYKQLMGSFDVSINRPYGNAANYPQTKLDEIKATFDAMSAKDDKLMACIPIMARAATDTEDEFIISDDPEDPVFYSSCYLISAPRTFIGITPETDEVQPDNWRHHGECISCEDFAQNPVKQKPWFEIRGKCTHCNLKPVKPPKVVEPYTMSSALTGTRCLPKSLSGKSCVRSFTFNDVPGWNSQTAPLSASTCAWIVSQQTECMKDKVMFNPSSGACMCQLASCGCDTVVGGEVVDLHDVLNSDDDLQPDPGCKKGVLKGKACYPNANYPDIAASIPTSRSCATIKAPCLTA
jgi:hypothetical protein